MSVRSNSSFEQIAYLNGETLPLADAKISTQDRGFLFGDGVYEVIPVFNKTPFEFAAHLKRLQNSLDAVSISNPMTADQWATEIQSIINLHPWQDQFIYLQVSRGVQFKRDHMPDDELTPTVLIYTNPLNPLPESIQQKGISVITLEDIRWLRCDIKATTLLPNVMMKLAAKQQNAQDAILINPNGEVSEGTASNVFIVKDGQVKTTPNSHSILPGITRQVILTMLNAKSIPCSEQTLTEDDLTSADEIWLTSSTKDALPVTQINQQPVGTGMPGQLWKQLQLEFMNYKQTYIEQHQT